MHASVSQLPRSLLADSLLSLAGWGLIPVVAILVVALAVITLAECTLALNALTVHMHAGTSVSLCVTVRP